MLNHKKFIVLLIVTASVVSAAQSALAHGGRRLEIGLLPNDQLFAQGVNTLNPAEVRPYFNAIHDHWENIGGVAAFAELPGWDLLDPDPILFGARIDLMLMDAWKWTSPDTVGPIIETALAPGDTIDIDFDGDTITTDALGGSLTLVDTVLPGGHDDLDVTYTIQKTPTGEIFVLELILKAFDAMGDPLAGVLPSDTVYVILSPDGELHHESLFVEQSLGTTPGAIPAPAALPAGLALLGLMGLRRRRR